MLDTKVRARGCVHRTPTERNERAQVWGSCKGMRAAQGNVQMYREAAVMARVRKILNPPTPREEFNTALCPGKPGRDVPQSAALLNSNINTDLLAEICHCSPNPSAILTPCFVTTGTALSPQPLQQRGGGSYMAASTGNTQAWTSARQRGWHKSLCQCRHYQVVRGKP